MPTFTKRTWKDLPTGGTAIDAANLNRMEQGIADAIAAAGSGGSTVIDASKAPYSVSTSGTAASNGAGLQQATIDANGGVVTLPPGDYPVSGCVLNDDHLNWYMPGVFLLQPQGPDSLLKCERTPGTPMMVSPTYLTWWGPWLPSNSTASGLMQVIPATGTQRFKGGHVYHISSRDNYNWSWSAQNIADFSTSDQLMYQAEFFTLLGIGLKVKTISNGGPLESMMVQGSVSNAIGMVQSVLFGNAAGGLSATQAQIIFTTVSGDFSNNENLVRIDGGNPSYSPTGGGIATVGQVVGVVDGAPMLLTTDIFMLQYGRTTAGTTGTVTPNRTDNTVQLREVDTKPMFRMRGVGFDIVGGTDDPDTYVTAANRSDVCQLRGVYAPDVEYRVRNAWTRAMCVWSSYLGHFSGFVDKMPNHAILTQSAFAYGMELKCACKGVKITLQGHNVRHLFTTNPNQRSWALANDNSAGKWTQWDYGTPIRNTVYDSIVECAFAPGLDSHPGDYFTTYMNCRIFGGGSGGRYNTDNNVGYNTRGFGTKWINVELEGSGSGIGIGGVEHDAGITYRNILENVKIGGVLSNAVVATSAKVPGQCTVEIVGGEFSGRTQYVDPTDTSEVAGGNNTTTMNVSKRYYQALILVNNGVNLEIRGEPLFRKFAGTWLYSKGIGDITIYSAAVDYSECPTSATGLRMEPGAGTSPFVKVFELKVAGNPATILRNQNGNTNWLLGDIQWLGTGTPPTLYTTTAGTPTYTQIAPMTNAGSGSSGPTIIYLPLDADTNAPTAGTTVSDLAALQTTLAVGTWDVEAILFLTYSATGAGAVRFGLGGAGASGATAPAYYVENSTNVNAKAIASLSALSSAGATATTGTNVGGTSAGVVTTVLPTLVKGRLMVTTSGTLGLVWTLSNGATATVVLKAGSYAKFTKVA